MKRSLVFLRTVSILFLLTIPHISLQNVKEKTRAKDVSACVSLLACYAPAGNIQQRLNPNETQENQTLAENS